MREREGQRWLRTTGGAVKGGGEVHGAGRGGGSLFVGIL